MTTADIPPIATRAKALDTLQAFQPRMGRTYTSGRNYDHGAGHHKHVSLLSPYVRRRLVTEHELVQAALEAHGPETAEKFIQEVLWRGYFKGWLERRPSVWSAYRDGLLADLEALSKDRKLRKAIERAENGATGLECFDAWTEELVETGYLHNHARMWFASIWIFTFGLPWRVGADFFYRHLLDGDPASNTCSWRWVAGLHTRGKTYAAQPWNISKFTNQRFTPRETDLAADVAGLEAEEPHGLPAVTPLRGFQAPSPAAPTALILTEDDCTLETFDLSAFEICASATLSTTHLRSPRKVSPDVCAFDAGALKDAAERMGLEPVEMHAGAQADLAKWVMATGAKQVVMPYVATGPLADWIEAIRHDLSARGIALCELQRDWDALIWPHATAGFFKIKKKMPDILHQSGLL